MSRRTALWLVSTLLLASCATGPQVGVRPEYRDTTLRDASVVPFFARSSFGLSEVELDEALSWTERAAVDWLVEHGVGVAEPDEARRRLETASQWSHFTDGGIFTRGLAASFESSPTPQRRQTQVSVLAQLHESDEIEETYVLFGELVYHTVSTCRTRADEYTPRAEVVVPPGAPESMPRPCIVSHFQARLVDSESGQTVWFNRRLRELHPPMINETWLRRNVRAVVRETLGGPGGLSGIVSGADQTS